MEMNLLSLKIVSIAGNNTYSTMVTYQKLSQSSEVLRKDQLGPTLLLLRLDDIDNCLRHCSIIKYADDIIYVSGNDSQSIQKKLNADLLKVHNWLTDNDLSITLRKGKTETMIFGTSIRVKKAAPLNIQIKGTSINQTSSYKYLGTHLDSKLALNGNFNSKYKKLKIAVKTTPRSACKSLKNDLH